MGAPRVRSFSGVREIIAAAKRMPPSEKGFPQAEAPGNANCRHGYGFAFAPAPTVACRQSSQPSAGKLALRWPSAPALATHPQDDSNGALRF